MSPLQVEENKLIKSIYSKILLIDYVSNLPKMQSRFWANPCNLVNPCLPRLARQAVKKTILINLTSSTSKPDHSPHP